VRGLVAEVEGASAALLDALLQRLRGAVQLPECLRIVGHLRRLAVFPEAELRRKRAPSPGPAPGSAAPLADSHAARHLGCCTVVAGLGCLGGPRWLQPSCPAPGSAAASCAARVGPAAPGPRSAARVCWRPDCDQVAAAC